MITDPIVDSVIQKHKDRSDAGMKKFGVSMEDREKDIVMWLEDAQEEAMDLALYLEKAIREIKNKDEQIRKLENEIEDLSR